MTSLIGFLFAGSAGCLAYCTRRLWQHDHGMRAAAILLSSGTILVVVATRMISPTDEYKLAPPAGSDAAAWVTASSGPTYRPVWALVAVGVVIVGAGVVAAWRRDVLGGRKLLRATVMLAAVTTVSALVVAQSVRWAEPRRFVANKPPVCTVWPAAGCV